MSARANEGMQPTHRRGGTGLTGGGNRGSEAACGAPVNDQPLVGAGDIA